MKRRIIITCLGVLVTAFLFMSTSFAASVAPDVNQHTQDEIRDYVEKSACTFDDIYSETSYLESPLLEAPFDPGKLSENTLDQALAQLNNIRYIAGLDPVELDPEYNEAAQSAALICCLNKELVKAKNSKGRKVTVKWLNDGSDGHVLYYAQSKNFQKGLMEITVDDASARKCTVKKLKKGKTYYFKVKSYTNVTNEATGETLKVYGKDSKVLKVKVRK